VPLATEVVLVVAQIITDIMEAELVAYSMGIVAYIMLFIGNATALRHLDSTLNQAFP